MGLLGTRKGINQAVSHRYAVSVKVKSFHGALFFLHYLFGR